MTAPPCKPLIFDIVFFAHLSYSDIFASCVTVVVSILADKYKKRSWFMVGAFTGATIGYIILIVTAGKPHLTGQSCFFRRHTLDRTDTMLLKA